MTYFLEVSSFNSQKVVIYYPKSSSKVFEYLEERCVLFVPFSSRVKIEEASFSFRPFTFNTFLEPEEIKEILINHPRQSVNNLPTQPQSTAIQATPQQGHMTNLLPHPFKNMFILHFLLNKYAPLDIPQPLISMPQDYLNILPRFNGEDDISAQRHIEILCAFAENMNVEHLDVVLRLFVQYLDGEEMKWFKSIPNASITT